MVSGGRRSGATGALASVVPSPFGVIVWPPLVAVRIACRV
ncbi:hypothetical protein L810_1679 [Burkholderia sp. AU4i]|nr:hypothetical protein L810_1679 [Burkholderia sp. AU4i]MDW9250458.1 putative membrane protein [Burkholderia cepacia]QOH37306.1 putative membrane protein [Burkholderia cepacia]